MEFPPFVLKSLYLCLQRRNYSISKPEVFENFEIEKIKNDLFVFWSVKWSKFKIRRFSFIWKRLKVDIIFFYILITCKLRNFFAYFWTWKSIDFLFAKKFFLQFLLSDFKKMNSYFFSIKNYSEINLRNFWLWNS